VAIKSSFSFSALSSDPRPKDLVWSDREASGRRGSAETGSYERHPEQKKIRIINVAGNGASLAATDCVANAVNVKAETIQVNLSNLLVVNNKVALLNCW
jgi:hypothetical protein